MCYYAAILTKRVTIVIIGKTRMNSTVLFIVRKVLLCQTSSVFKNSCGNRLRKQITTTLILPEGAVIVWLKKHTSQDNVTPNGRKTWNKIRQCQSIWPT